MKILVKTDACVGHAQCHRAAPTLFPLDDSGYNTLAEVIQVPPGQEEAARRGVRACPERILTIVEDEAPASP
ncbi:MAG: ferredoxin [Rhodocyclaceae bacterium]|jgi:ferredoxin|nr:ferredoxin [Rhodocyclaceae bacterium]